MGCGVKVQTPILQNPRLNSGRESTRLGADADTGRQSAPEGATARKPEGFSAKHVPIATAVL